ncbi:hypothetical protein [Bacillus pumilus]|uniref:hypothetical protein n=1 Tax=Bacillus pumilus TaxID=1408 RepID=UPI00119CDB83|nr:hypothetical protein [Bacillus pumilus]
MIENQNKEHIEFLREHLDILTRLKETGYRCDREINDVLSKLHGIVFKQKPTIRLGDNRFISNGGKATDKLVDSELNERFKAARPKLASVDAKNDRGKGKTTILLNCCYDESVLVVVGNATIAKLYRELYNDILEENGIFKLGGTSYILTVDQLNGRRGEVLIDESVSEKQLQKIKENQNIEILGGFYTA